MSKLSLFSTFIALSLLLSACSKNEEETIQANEILSTNEFVLTEINKTQYTVNKETDGFSLQNAKNKVVLFDIFATWCPPCRASASHLSSLQKKYKDSLVIIGITVENNLDNKELLAFRKKYNAQYLLVNSHENARLIDVFAKELKLGRNFGIPLVVMYKEGKLINFYQGATEEEFIESDIKKALGK